MNFAMLYIGDLKYSNARGSPDQHRRDSKGLKTIEKEDGIYIKTQKRRKIARHHLIE